MEIFRVDTENPRQVKEFLSLPYRIYTHIPQWVPPLRSDDRMRLDTQRNPYYRHSQAAFFIAHDGREIVGRIAVLDSRLYNEHNHEKTAFFYLFECLSDSKAASLLFEAGFAWAHKRGLEKIIGPKGFTALDGLGLLIKGFHLRPALGLPYNPDYYPHLVEEQGFSRSTDIVSGYLSPTLQFPERIHEIAARVQERRGLHIARFRTRAELRKALSHLKALYNGALEGTSGGTPITDDEVKAMADQMLWFADPAMIKIVMKGHQPVGFLLAYPDISAALQKTKGRLFPFGWITILQELRRTDWLNINGAGILPEYRGLGGISILYSELFKSVTSHPRYRHAEVVQIGLENDRMQREMENFGVDFYKVHRLYTRPL